MATRTTRTKSVDPQILRIDLYVHLFGFWQYGMPELLRCEHLKATIRTAMRSWEAANANIRFFEVIG